VFDCEEKNRIDGNKKEMIKEKRNRVEIKNRMFGCLI